VYDAFVIRCDECQFLFHWRPQRIRLMLIVETVHEKSLVKFLCKGRRRCSRINRAARKYASIIPCTSHSRISVARGGNFRPHHSLHLCLFFLPSALAPPPPPALVPFAFNSGDFLPRCSASLSLSLLPLRAFVSLRCSTRRSLFLSFSNQQPTIPCPLYEKADILPFYPQTMTAFASKQRGK